MQPGDIVELVNARLPPAVRTLNGRAVGWDANTPALTLAFRVEPAYANYAGAAQGGIVTVMLDAAMGLALAALRGEMQNVPTLDIGVRFLRPTPLGELTCTGRIVKNGRRVAFTSAVLYAPDDKATAEATATSLLPE